MKKLLHALLAVVILCSPACSFLDGVRVKIRSDAAKGMKGELVAFLSSKGFTVDDPAETTSFRFSAIRWATAGQRVSLIANFYEDGAAYTFFVGKGNSREYVSDELAIIEDCVALLAAHPEFVVNGSASKASTTEGTRQKFYAKFSKS